MEPTQGTVERVKYFVAGKWCDSASTNVCNVYNPSVGEVIAQTPLCDVEETKAVIAVARNAFESWRQVPVIERARVMFRLRELMDREFEELAALVTQEHGKTISESRAEVKRGLEMVEFAASIPSWFTGVTMPELAAGVDGETARHPLGVCVGITPYNFPCMVPLWMIPIAITCGNSFILKPSEKVPLSANRIAELLQASGLPDGVFNVVHGSRQAVETLLTAPEVEAVSFVGSTQVARTVYETATRHGKRVQAAGGAKNHLIVMPDADVDVAVEALAASAYGCAGQRCMAGSVAVTVGSIGDTIVDQLRDRGESMQVGPTDNGAEVDMGPLINLYAVQRVEGYLEKAADEGAVVTLDGRRDFQSDAFLVGPSVVDHVKPGTLLAEDEIFGPLLSVIRTPDLESAIAVGDRCRYGNGASIFTRDGHAAREFKQRFNAGMIGINVGVPAPMAWLSFTGWNQSFFGDLHIQGTEGIQFYSQQRTTLSRWLPRSGEDPVWATR